jgi:threonine-phosphate decarboxylase
MSKAVHGGRVQEAARNLCLPITRIVDFSANINPLGQPAGLGEVISEAIESILHYPDLRAEALTQSIADYASLPSWTVIAGSGSTPLIYQLARILCPQKPLIIAPAFAEYGSALEIISARDLKYHQTSEYNYFSLTIPEAEAIVKSNPELIFLANPANPTGRKTDPEILEILLKGANRPGKEYFLAVDEAFMGFCLEDSSLESRILKNPQLIVLKSLTKLFAIPGLRLGYLASGNKELIDKFNSSTEPWSINSLAQAAGIYLLKQRDFIAETPKVTLDLRLALVEAVSPYVKVIPSDANFVMGRLTLGSKAELIKHLYSQAILVRDLDGMPGMPAGFIRLAVRPLNEIKRLQTAMGDFYARTA